MGLYRGVANVAREIKEEWRGVSGVARKIVEEWRGVGGVARQCFSGSCKVTITNGMTGYGYVRFNGSGENYTSGTFEKPSGTELWIYAHCVAALNGLSQGAKIYINDSLVNTNAATYVYTATSDVTVSFTQMLGAVTGCDKVYITTS